MKRRRGLVICVTDEAQQAVRRAFEPHYHRPLENEEVVEIADNLRRFFAVLARWDEEDRAFSMNRRSA